VPCTDVYQAEREEAEAKFANLQRRKFISEQKHEQFVQLCTDKEGSASDMSSVASKRSSASSLARKHEMIALRWKQKELSLEIERAPAVARMELLRLKRLCQRRLVQGRNVRNNCSSVLLRPTSAKMSLAAVRTSLKTFYLFLLATLLTLEQRLFKGWLDEKPSLNVTAKDFVPKQRAFINRDETLSASHPYVSAQSLPVGPVPLGNVNTSNVNMYNAIISFKND